MGTWQPVSSINHQKKCASNSKNSFIKHAVDCGAASAECDLSTEPTLTPSPHTQADHSPERTSGPQTQVQAEPNPHCSASCCSRTCSNKMKIDFHFNDFTHNKKQERKKTIKKNAGKALWQSLKPQIKKREKKQYEKRKKKQLNITALHRER